LHLTCEALVNLCSDLLAALLYLVNDVLRELDELHLGTDSGPLYFFFSLVDLSLCTIKIEGLKFAEYIPHGCSVFGMCLVKAQHLVTLVTTAIFSRNNAVNAYKGHLVLTQGLIRLPMDQACNAIRV
jgi:hypothetical protein